MLDRELSNFSDVVMSLLLSETGESDSRLTTTTVLFGELDLHTLEHFFVVSLESGVQHTVTIDDNESELLIVSQQVLEGLGVEAVLTLVSEYSLRLEGLKINSDLLV